MEILRLLVSLWAVSQTANAKELMRAEEGNVLQSVVRMICLVEATQTVLESHINPFVHAQLDWRATPTSVVIMSNAELIQIVHPTRNA